jgi:hypothetical protein
MITEQLAPPKIFSGAIRYPRTTMMTPHISRADGGRGHREVFLISGDPVFGDLLLCGSNIKLSSTDHVAQPSLQPIFGFGVPFRLYAAPHLRPEVGRVIATAQGIAVQGGRSHSLDACPAAAHIASVSRHDEMHSSGLDAPWVSACRQSIMTVYPHRATSQVRVRPDFDCRCRRHNGKQCGGYEPDYHRWHHWSFFMGWFFQSALPMRQSLQVTFALALPASS